ncbi:MAG TPA: WecB/TagA/CpsF family glycosyltransferase [Thermosynechococcaceae cyanobacterium]
MTLILEWAKLRLSKAVCIANVHMLVEAHRNASFASVLQSADLVTPDGMPLVWMLKLLGSPKQDRVAGLDVLQALCDRATTAGVSVFFLGSQGVILEQMRERLNQEFPDLQIAGMEPLPFRPMTQAEDAALVQTLNQSGAGIVFVSLGCPKQEIWMAQHQQRVNAVMIGLGGAFPVYAGLQKRAPGFVRSMGFEWLYRLLQEPKRLWGRYSSTIPLFIWLACKQLFVDQHKEPLKSFDDASA